MDDVVDVVHRAEAYEHGYADDMATVSTGLVLSRRKANWAS